MSIASILAAKTPPPAPRPPGRPRGQSPTARIFRDVAVAALAAHEHSIEDMARAFKVSPRSLRRWAAERGVSV